VTDRPSSGDPDSAEGAPEALVPDLLGPVDAVDLLLGVEVEPLGSDDPDDEMGAAGFVGAASIVVSAAPLDLVVDAPDAPRAPAVPMAPSAPAGWPADVVASPMPTVPPATDPERWEAEPAPTLPGRVPDANLTWGPRPHPPAVQAPSPPPPLGAPPRSSSGAIPIAVPPRHVVPPAAPLGVPERPSHPRVRRWFGRPGADDGTAEVSPTGADVGAPSGGAPVGSASADPSAPTPAVAPVLPPEPDLGDALVDPWALGRASDRMSAGARRAGAVALGILSTLLEDGEVVEVVVQGSYQHQPGVAALTDRRVLVVNQRRWVPDVRSIVVGRDLVIQGWQDERHATLVFASDGRSVVLSAIDDRPLARDLARQARERVAGRGGPSVP